MAPRGPGREPMVQWETYRETRDQLPPCLGPPPRGDGVRPVAHRCARRAAACRGLGRRPGSRPAVGAGRDRGRAGPRRRPRGRGDHRHRRQRGRPRPRGPGGQPGWRHRPRRRRRHPAGRVLARHARRGDRRRGRRQRPGHRRRRTRRTDHAGPRPRRGRHRQQSRRHRGDSVGGPQRRRRRQPVAGRGRPAVAWSELRRRGQRGVGGGGAGRGRSRQRVRARQRVRGRTGPGRQRHDPPGRQARLLQRGRQRPLGHVRAWGRVCAGDLSPGGPRLLDVLGGRPPRPLRLPAGHVDGCPARRRCRRGPAVDGTVAGTDGPAAARDGRGPRPGGS